MAASKQGVLPPGVRIAGHVIERVLGNGGFGKTYVVREERTGAARVLKEYFPERAAQRRPGSNDVMPIPGRERSFHDGFRSFVNEAEVLRDLPRHPNIVGVFGLFEKHDTIYMLMELVEGVPLAYYLDQPGSVGEAELFRTLRRICRGLTLIHDRRLLHRDIKPQNIMITRKGGPVLIDFGAARLTGDRDFLTSIYTPGFAPIEQLGQARSLGLKEGPWTDLYATGALAYQFATGKVPADSWRRYEMVSNGSPDPFAPCGTQARGHYSPAFCRAVDWALSLDPERRPARAEEWVEALEGRAKPHHSVHVGWGAAPVLAIAVARVRRDAPAQAAAGEAGPRRSETVREGPEADIGASFFSSREGDGFATANSGRSIAGNRIWVNILIMMAILAAVGAAAVAISSSQQ